MMKPCEKKTMDRDAQIEEALRILQPGIKRGDIEHAIDFVHSVYQVSHTKDLPLDEELSANKYCAWEVDDALNVLGVEFANHSTTTTPKKKEFRQKVEQLRRALVRARGLKQDLWIVRFGFRALCPDLNGYIEKCDEFLTETAGKPRRSGYKKRRAAFYARDLMQKFGCPLVRTASGDWCKLAAVLYGDKKAKLHHAVRSVSIGRSRS